MRWILLAHPNLRRGSINLRIGIVITSNQARLLCRPTTLAMTAAVIILSRHQYLPQPVLAVATIRNKALGDYQMIIHRKGLKYIPDMLLNLNTLSPQHPLNRHMAMISILERLILLVKVLEDDAKAGLIDAASRLSPPFDSISYRRSSFTVRLQRVLHTQHICSSYRDMSGPASPQSFPAKSRASQR